MNAETMQNIEAMQEEMHKVIDWMMNRNPKLSYDDCKTVYLLWQIQILKDELSANPLPTNP
jgi:hypothetical protein